MHRILLALLLLLALTGTVAAQANQTTTSTPDRVPDGSEATESPMGASPTATSRTTPTSSPTTTPTPTASPTPARNITYAADLPGDPAVRIRDWTYLNKHNTFIITIESDVPRLVTLTYVSESSGDGASVGTIERKAITSGVTEIRATVPSGVVWVATDTSQRNGKFLQLEADTGGSLIPEPYDASDVRDAGIGGALGALLALIYEAIVAKAGANEWGERLA